MPFQTILVAFDGSDPARRALTRACEMARTDGADLHLVTTPEPAMDVFAVEPFGGYVSVPPTDEAVAEAGKLIETQARALAAEAGVTKLEIHIRRGDPSDTILALADTTGADLIVMGKRGLGPFAAFALGSISLAVTRQANCACMTVA